MVVRDAETLQILSLQTCLDPVQRLEWSPDSQFVMCGMFKRGVVQVRAHTSHARTLCAHIVLSVLYYNYFLARILTVMTPDHAS